MSIFELLNDSLALNASDLHLSSGLLESFMTDQQNADFAEHLETDFSYVYKNIARFRVNVFQQNRGPGAVLITIPTTVLSMDQCLKTLVIDQLISVNHAREKARHADDFN